MDFFNITQKNIKEIQNNKKYIQTPTNAEIYKNVAIPQREIKNGDSVVIIRKENSKYNYYKGYTGEVIKYKRNQENVYILLPNFHIINIPQDHFMIL